MGIQDIIAFGYGIATAMLLHGKIPFWQAALLGGSIVVIAVTLNHLL